LSLAAPPPSFGEAVSKPTPLASQHRFWKNF
jgi:hypothetical protein